MKSCFYQHKQIESILIMVERAPRRESINHGIEVSRITTKEDLIPYVAFMTRIFLDLPDYYSDEIKKHLAASVALEHTIPLLSNPDIQMHQAKDVDGTIVGFGNGRMKSIEGVELPRVGYIAWMGVDASVRGKGVAAKIIGALEDGFLEHNAPISVCFIKDRNVASIKRFSWEGYTADTRIPPSLDGTQGRFYSKPLLSRR